MRLFEIKEKLPSVKTYDVKYIAKKHGVSEKQIKDQLKKGIEVEYEHTKDEQKSKEIALDHLLELPDYYDRLERVEEDEKYLYKPNVADRQAKEMGLPDQYKNTDWGKKKKTRREKVTVRDTKTGKVYGQRTMVQKNT